MNLINLYIRFAYPMPEVVSKGEISSKRIREGMVKIQNLQKSISLQR